LDGLVTVGLVKPAALRLFKRSTSLLVSAAGLTGAGAALRYDYANTSAGIQRKVMGIFAKAISLRAQTDANRIAVLTVGSDIMATQLRSLAMIPAANRAAMFSSGMGLTKEQCHIALFDRQECYEVMKLVNDYFYDPLDCVWEDQF